jgi:hypothetical protein
MSTRNYYGVFVIGPGAGPGALKTSRKEAMDIAKRLHNDCHLEVEVWKAPQATFAGGTQYGIDRPTFIAQADLIKAYRK